MVSVTCDCDWKPCTLNLLLLPNVLAQKAFRIGHPPAGHCSAQPELHRNHGRSPTHWELSGRRAQADRRNQPSHTPPLLHRAWRVGLGCGRLPPTRPAVGRQSRHLLRRQESYGGSISRMDFSRATPSPTTCTWISWSYLKAASLLWEQNARRC